MSQKAIGKYDAANASAAAHILRNRASQPASSPAVAQLPLPLQPFKSCA